MLELCRQLNITLEDIILEVRQNTTQYVGRLKPEAHQKVLNYKISQLMSSQLSMTNSPSVETMRTFSVETGRFEKNFKKVDVLGEGAFGKVD